MSDGSGGSSVTKGHGSEGGPAEDCPREGHHGTLHRLRRMVGWS